MDVRRASLRCLLALSLLPASVPSCGGGGGGSGLCSPQGNFPVGLLRGPQTARPSPTSMTIAFATISLGVGSVDFGLTTTYDGVVSDLAPATEHVLALEGLAPATAYHYRIALDGAPLGGDHVFSTAPAGTSSPVRFVVLGDTGTGCSTEFDAVAETASLAPDFVLDTGDVAYSSGTAFEVQSRFIVPFADLCATTPVFPVLGNHDVNSEGGQPLLDAFVLPTNASDASSHYYSFDYGPCHVIALDSNQATGPSSPQGIWLAADLAAANAPWLFCLLHHPAYSSSRHGNTATVDADWVPLFDAYHVDVVFSGHDHDYERTFPMLAGAPVDAAAEPDFLDPKGTVYVVSGGGGSDLYPAGTSAFTAHSESAHHVTEVSIDGGILTLRAVRLDGTEMDRMTLTKTP